MKIDKKDMFKLKRIALKKQDDIIGMIYKIEDYYNPTACVYTISGEDLRINIDSISKIGATRISKEFREQFDKIAKNLKDIDKLEKEKEDFIAQYNKKISMKNKKLQNSFSAIKKMYKEETGLVSKDEFQNIIVNNLTEDIKKLEDYHDWNNIFCYSNSLEVSISALSIKYPDVSSDFNGMLYLEYDNSMHSNYTDETLFNNVQRYTEHYKGPQLKQVINRTKKIKGLVDYKIEPFLEIGDKTVSAGFSIIVDFQKNNIELTQENAITLSNEIKTILKK